MKKTSDPGHISYWFIKDRRNIAIVTLTGIIYNIGLGAGPWFEGKLVQRLADILAGRSLPSSMIYLALAYLAVIITVQLARALKRLYVRKFANNTGLGMKKLVFRSMLSSGFADAGNEITKSQSDVEACAEGMRKVLTEIFDTGVALTVFIVMLFVYDPILALIVCVFPPIAMLCAGRMKKIVTSRTAAGKESAAAMNSEVLDRVSNAVTYRAYGVEEFRNERLEAAFADYEKKSILANLWENCLTPVYRVISTAGAVFVILLGGMNVLGKGTAVWDIAAFTTFFSVFLKLSVKASKTAKLFNSVQKAGVSWKRIKDRLVPVKDNGLPVPAAPGELVCENISFAYPGKAPVYSDLSFSVKPGQIIGITGEIASGKSTLGRTFLCEQPFGGRILFGGKDLNGLLEDRTTVTVGYMGHSPELFDGSLADNIKMGAEGDISDVLDAVRLTDEVSAFPDGINTRVGNGGIMLSGGQQARVALARALFSKAPLLVLDDPFSAVDMTTEAEILRGIRRLSPDTAVLLISHRITCFPTLDGVIMMPGDGTAVFSDHSSLMSGDAVYRRLYQLQTGKEEPTND